MKKNDYTYILLLDSVSTGQIRNIQNRLAEKLGHSEYMDQWVPHITVSHGNILLESEVRPVLDKLKEVLHDQRPFDLQIEGVVIQEKTVKEESYVAIRLKLVSTPELNELSSKVVAVSESWEVPIDVFTHDHFHIGLGRYKAGVFNEQEVYDLVSDFKEIRLIAKKVSLFYSMMNDPKPEKAYEVGAIEFI